MGAGQSLGEISVLILLQLPEGDCSIEVPWTLLLTCLLHFVASVCRALTLGQALSGLCAVSH